MRRNDDDDEPTPVDLSRGTFAMQPAAIVKAVWTMAGIFVAGTVAVVSQLYQLRASIEEVSRKVDSKTSDRWTLSMEREEMYRFGRENPMVHAPDADDIWNKIRPWDYSK